MKKIKCPMCNGEKIVEYDNNGADAAENCPVCYGKGSITKQKTDYATLEKELNDNHFYPIRVVEISKQKANVIGLEISCPALILMNDRTKVIEMLLAQYEVNVSPLKNEGIIRITM